MQLTAGSISDPGALVSGPPCTEGTAGSTHDCGCESVEGTTLANLLDGVSRGYKDTLVQDPDQLVALLDTIRNESSYALLCDMPGGSTVRISVALSTDANDLAGTAISTSAADISNYVDNELQLVSGVIGPPGGQPVSAVVS